MSVSEKISHKKCQAVSKCSLFHEDFISATKILNVRVLLQKPQASGVSKGKKALETTIQSQHLV